MPSKKTKANHDAVLETLRNLLIVQLAQAGVGVEDIRRVLGVGKERINQVYKYLATDKRGRKG